MIMDMRILWHHHFWYNSPRPLESCRCDHLTSSNSPAPSYPAPSASVRTAGRRPNAWLSCCTVDKPAKEKKKKRFSQWPAEGILIHLELSGQHLRTLCGGALSLEPAHDAGEAEKVAAAQRWQPVLARRRPRLETNGAGVALALFTLGCRSGLWQLRERLHAKIKKSKKKSINTIWICGCKIHVMCTHTH